MERCKEYLVSEPETRKGAWRTPGRSLNLEIGCGKGSFTCALAAAEPEQDLVAIEKGPDATAYLLDYASFYEKDGARKGALIMEIADKADTAAKVFVIICNRDEKTVCDPIRHEDVKSLFEYAPSDLQADL